MALHGKSFIDAVIGNINLTGWTWREVISKQLLNLSVPIFFKVNEEVPEFAWTAYPRYFSFLVMSLDPRRNQQ